MVGFGTMRKDGSQQVGLPAPVVLPPLAKQVLREQHSQSDKNRFVYLAKESHRNSHIVILQRPSMLEHRGVIALSAICAQMSQAAPQFLQSPLPIGNRITPPFYKEAV